jgi:hypothetical protein
VTLKSLKLILLATAVLAIASLAVATSIQAQGKSVTNTHSHTDEKGTKSNYGIISNTDDSHSNYNDNTNRHYDGECCGDRERDNTHPKPNPGGNSDNGEP